MTRKNDEKINNSQWPDKAAIKLTAWIGSTPSIVTHTVLFVFAFISPLFGFSFDRMLLVLTTAVSLEAIYLAIFIQMTVNRNTQSLEEVEEDIDEIVEDIDEIQEDIDEIVEDVDEIIVEDEDDSKKDAEMKEALLNIQSRLESLLKDVEKIKK